MSGNLPPIDPEQFRRLLKMSRFRRDNVIHYVPEEKTVEIQIWKYQPNGTMLPDIYNIETLGA